MTPNAEPLEWLTVLASLVWLALVVGLLVRWTAVLARVGGMPAPDVMRLMVLIRLTGYGSALLLAAIVFASGLLQATTPRPISPSPWREVFQAGWLLIAVTQVMTIIAVDVMTRAALGVPPAAARAEGYAQRGPWDHTRSRGRRTRDRPS